MNASMALIFHTMLLSLASCINGLNVANFWSAPYLAWFPIVILAVLAIISILSVIYALSPFLGRTDLRVWSRLQVYQLLLAVVLVLVFASFATLICSVNPEGLLQSFRLIPKQCVGAGTIYSTAICDMFQFNQYTATYNEYFFFIELVITLQPALTFHFNLLNLVPAGAGLGFSGGFSAGPVELFPAMTSYKYLGVVLDALYSAVLLNQIQLILLSASALLFSIFMAIGLVARAFGITRSFGGAMIAFAIGIGFIYPLLVSITYGFIDYGLSELSAQPTPSSVLFGFITWLMHGATAAPLSIIPQTLFNAIGLISMGMIVVPLINFVILDTFITDFSSAVGERMDFLSLLTRII